MTLYEMTGEWIALLDMLEDPDTDPQAIADTLEGLEGELEDKADNYAAVIDTLKADSAALKAEEERLRDRRKAVDNNIDRMKRSLENMMLTTGKTKFKTLRYSFGIQKNPPSVVLDGGTIPEEYLIPAEPTVNKKQMIIDLRSGKDLTGIAHIEQTESLRIR